MAAPLIRSHNARLPASAARLISSAMVYDDVQFYCMSVTDGRACRQCADSTSWSRVAQRGLTISLVTVVTVLQFLGKGKLASRACLVTKHWDSGICNNCRCIVTVHEGRRAWLSRKL